MPRYCNTCGHNMDCHYPKMGRKGRAPCNARLGKGLCSCRGYVRIESEPKREEPEPEADGVREDSK
ncbi:hypothetical protein LCGC14_0446530 [marine sediment metagenome]|uniref:Uncharacterized protein n=1 Tax=marine sediment metagenome TaxID=412755 RepID=A0A0F9VT88_9ZZZZ